MKDQWRATLASVAGLFNSSLTPGGRQVGSDKIGLCVNVLFMACSALFMVLFTVLFRCPVPARTAFEYE